MAAPTYEIILSGLGYQSLPMKAKDVYESWLHTDRLWMVSKDDISWILDVLAFDEMTKKCVQSAFEIIKADALLTNLFSFLQYALIIGAHPSDWLIKEAPHINHPEVSSSVFQLMTILSLIPVAKKDYEKRQIDEVHMLFNLNHLKGYIKNYREKHHEVGIENFGWTTYLASLGLIHLSSLHFMHHVYTDRFIFIRHRQTKQVIALAESAIHVRVDGQFDGVNGYYKEAFITHYEETDTHYTGFRVNPMGSITSEQSTYDKNDFELILKPGDYVIDFHIPTKSDYSVEGFKHSLELATQFFQTHYPDYKYPAFWCVSWLYSPQINMLIENQNAKIRLIAKEGYRIPATPDAKSLYTFVFGTSDPDFKNIVPKTSLEANVIKHLNQGYTINAGCYLYFMDDLSQFGSTPYVSHQDEASHHVMIQRK